jgi:hypothetical protein
MGLFGEGLYTTSCLARAARYGRPVKVKLRFQRPLRGQWREVRERILALRYIEARRLGFASPEQAYAAGASKRLHGRVRERLHTAGYDGLVVEMPTEQWAVALTRHTVTLVA